MQTLTQIGNLALIAIRKDPIQSLEEVLENPNAASPNQKSALTINAVLEQVLRKVQSKSRWSDLQTEATLTLESEPTTEVPYYVYIYPTDVLGYVRLKSYLAFQVKGQRLYTRDPAAVLEYVRYSREPSEWNAFLTEAIVAELAAAIAPKLSADNEIAAETKQTAKEALIDAAASDYTNRSSAKEKDEFFGLNQVRAGVDPFIGGRGRNSRLR